MPALRTRDTQSRTLEVTTDASAPQPPSLHIVSPTPRSFTFPSTHNLSDSPYSSPSSSPFEPDLRSLPSSSSHCTLSTSTPPPPPVARPFSPESPSVHYPTESPITTSNLKRRKSSCSSDVVERRPKKGDEDYIKRPENAFILFRRKCCEDRQAVEEGTAAAADGPTKKQRQADLSKTISQQWKSLSAEERQFWEQLAKDKKKEHEALYPNYVYRPQRAKDKDSKLKGKKLKKIDQEETDSVSFVVPVNRGFGRSASMPTPPPFQSIQVPNVYQFTPSCPTSPSLLPMISRRSAHPGHQEPVDILSNFDYVPNNSYVPPSFSVPGQFEATLQVSIHRGGGSIEPFVALSNNRYPPFKSSEFLRSMFNVPNQQQQQQSQQPQQLNLQSNEPSLLPAHQIVSPASSIGSGSSGPSSPATGPYTPTNALVSHFLPQPTNLTGLEAQAQAEMELQMEMQMQAEFANFQWGGSANDLWGNEPSVLMGDDFDIHAIPPIELGIPKYTESMALAGPTALEFGQEFTQALEARQFSDESQRGLIAFDEMMAGHVF
ncbi:hypothetical protein CVT24_000685 [Panaeolus cyanescens]|uniref:HMG box domain-containing protein n=1 Tax=Panaeolus cyanescens TaxID=181874 RepID=A0A409VWG3_9AGAR|nr:hypothetical protein CVT24_000685 [Panaeolus cyanescens]